MSQYVLKLHVLSAMSALFVHRGIYVIICGKMMCIVCCERPMYT